MKPGNLERMLYYLRTNDLKRSLYLAYLHLVAPLLEPLRRLLARFLMLPGRSKKLVLLTLSSVCLLLIALVGLWSLVPFLLPLLLVIYFTRYLYAKLRTILRMRYWRARRDELVKAGAKGYALTVEHLGLLEDGLEALQKDLEKSSEVGIADIDQDGFLLARFGSIPGAVNVDQEDFLKRKRYVLQIVAVGNKIGVKKYYGQNVIGFLNELEALHSLAGCCNVPAILDVDFSGLTITLSYIPGAVLREELAKRGAVLRNRDTDNDPDFRRLAPKERRLRRIAEGRRVLRHCVDRETVENIFRQLKEIHRAGICVSDVKYGNIIIERVSREPYFIDFDHSVDYGRRRGLRWQVRRDYEIETFNLCFDTERLTRDRMLRKLGQFARERLIRRDCSVDFGHGLAMGRTWDVEFGEGRWHYILKPNLPSLSGKRVLELGCKNAFFLLQMLRHGAREAVGIECDEGWIGQAQFIKEGFEWADSTTYDLEVIDARMEEVPNLELGRFDLVLALCSLYCLSSDLVDTVIRHVRTLTEWFIVQCDAAPEECFPDIRLKASVDYNIEALERSGFSVTRVVAPPGYRRPLLIGVKA